MQEIGALVVLIQSLTSRSISFICPSTSGASLGHISVSWVRGPAGIAQKCGRKAGSDYRTYGSNLAKPFIENHLELNFACELKSNTFGSVAIFLLHLHHFIKINGFSFQRRNHCAVVVFCSNGEARCGGRKNNTKEVN